MDIFELLNIENRNIEEAKNKYQKLLIIYELGMIMNKDDEEICEIYRKKISELKEAGDDFFKDIKQEELVFNSQDSHYIYSKVYSCLNTVSIEEEQINELKKLLTPMPDCGMKYYLLARLEMCDMNYYDFYSASEAISIYTLLNKALEFDPSNSLYLEYAKLFEEAIEANRVKETAQLEQINKEIAERKRREEERVAQEEMKKIMEKVGEIVPVICFCVCCGSCCC